MGSEESDSNTGVNKTRNGNLTRNIRTDMLVNADTHASATTLFIHTYIYTAHIFIIAIQYTLVMVNTGQSVLKD